MTLEDRIKKAIKGLVYISETDSKFSLLPRKTIMIGRTRVVAFDDFFARLTTVQSWFGEAERKQAQQFENLRHLLSANLSDLVVLKVFKTKTNLDIFIFGMDSNGHLVGVKTEAVET